MSDKDEKDRASRAALPPRASATPPDDPPAEGKRSGRVAFDSRNNPIWEWQLETGVYSRDVSTQKLKKLDLGDLSIAESAIQQRPPGLNELAGKGKNESSRTGNVHAPLPGGGFNPYDSSSRPVARDPYDNARALGSKVNADSAPVIARPLAKSAPVQRPAAPVVAPKPSVLDKLGNLFKRKPKDDEDYE